MLVVAAKSTINAELKEQEKTISGVDASNQLPHLKPAMQAVLAVPLAATGLLAEISRWSISRPSRLRPVSQGQPASALQRKLPRALLKQLSRLPRQFRRNPEHVLQMLRPVARGPFNPLAVAAPEQRSQLLQFVFEKVGRAGAGGVRRCARGGGCCGRCRRGTPGHNSFSHVLCSLSKVFALNVVRRLGC